MLVQGVVCRKNYLLETGVFKSEDIDIENLKTDEVFIFLQNDTGQLWGIQVGKPSNHNVLYGRKELENKAGSIKQLIQIPGLNRINIIDTSISLDLP